MGYQLGVDLGTTYTAAALSRDGRVELVPLGDRSTVMPSVAFIGADGQILVGEPANRRGVLEPERVAREFKRRVGDPTPMVVGGSPYPADALVARLLRAVVDEVAEREGARPDGLALTHPANWGPYKLDFFRQAVGLAGLDTLPVTYLSEPEAAAMHYAASERVPPGAVVAVYDLGGGTFDAAVLRHRDDGGFEVIGRPEGIERLGGVDFDAGVFAHVDDALGGAVSRLDPDDEAAVHAVARLRAECVGAKEALSRDVDVAIPVVLPSLSTTVRLTRSELEAMIRPALGETITALRGALRSAGVTPGDVHAVLLVGGSSRIPLVAQMVSAEIGRPVAVDAHPKHAVAQGAAAAAAARAGAASPEAVTIVQVAEAPAPPVPAAQSPQAAPGWGSPPEPPPPGPVVTATPGGPVPPAPSGPTTPPGGSPAEPPPPGPIAPIGATATPGGPPPEPPPGLGGPSPTGRPQQGQGIKRPAVAVVAAVAVLVAAVVGVMALQGDGDEPNVGGEDWENTPVAEREPLTEDVPDPQSPAVPRPVSEAVPSPPTPDVPAATGTPPTSTDATLQALIDACAGSAVDDCDRLYDASSSDEAVHAYARTCGNRLDDEEADGDCIIRFHAIPTDTNSDVQALVDSCGGEAVDDCDRLYDETAADGGPAYTYARTCGHRLEDNEADGDCIIRFHAIPTDTNSDVQSLIEGCAGDAVDDCDRLYDETSADGGPAYTYARTCGHRLEDNEADGDCVVRFRAIPTDENGDVQAFIDGCASDAVDDCDRLYQATANATGPTYDYARTCGHRLDDDEASGDCTLRFHAVPTSPDSEEQDLIDACAEESVRGCDDLYEATSGEEGPSYTFARTCGHRLEEATASGDCAGPT